MARMLTEPLDTLHAINTSRKRGLQQIKSNAIKKFKGQPYFEKLSRSTVENLVWTPYKPVAHLWAAYRYWSDERKVAGEKPIFPCRHEDLPEWLALAEQWRRQGEAARVGQGGALLSPGKTWAVPPEISLPSPPAMEWVPSDSTNSSNRR
jgi:hypothetical protein